MGADKAASARRHQQLSDAPVSLHRADDPRHPYRHPAGQRIEARDVRDIVICSVILVAWIAFASWLHKWSSKPPSPKTRIRAWRGELTALANGFESQSREGATFTSLITAEDRTHFSPRFVADGIEFGNIRYRSRSRSGKWHYIAIQVPISLPHLLLDSHAGKSLERMLPVHVGRYQTLSLEGDFDR